MAKNSQLGGDMGFNLPEIKGDIVFESFPAGPLQCNCSIVGDPVTKRCVVVDPGGDPGDRR